MVLSNGVLTVATADQALAPVQTSFLSMAPIKQKKCTVAVNTNATEVKAEMHSCKK